MIKLLMVELVNTHVEDMIRIVRAMSSDKTRQLMVDLIESLDREPPKQIQRSRIAQAKALGHSKSNSLISTSQSGR